MGAQSRATLKSYFQTGDQPTQAEYEDLMDSAKLEGDDIGTTTPAAVHSDELAAKATVPATSGDAGEEGEIRVDAGHIYVYHTGAWKRAALTSF
jgi:hypothetical protein